MFIRNLTRRICRTVKTVDLSRNNCHSSTTASQSQPAESTQFDEDLVLTSQCLGKAVIMLNRPQALNSINLEMVQKISSYMKECESSQMLMIIKGAGNKSFCAGGDVRALVEDGPTPESKDFFREEYTLNALIANYKIPFIAFMDGITMGGGVGLSVHSKYRIATERTLFAMPETAIGLFPDIGGSYFLPRLTGKLGYFLGLTGYRLKGEDVLHAGIATNYCKSSKLCELEAALFNCGNIKNIQNIIDDYTIQCEGEFTLNHHMDEINECFSACSVEEIFQNLERKNSKWSNHTLQTLKKMSPTSLKVTLRELQYGEKMSLNECLMMEHRLAVRHLENSDFKEGVRAVLIDKDQNPKWKPATLEEVTDERVQSFFAKLPEDEELKLK